MGFAASNAYGTSKAGVVIMTRTMAAEWGRRGVRVNAVAPGMIDTGMMRPAVEATPFDDEDFLARIPAGRFGAGEDVARVVCFLASDWAGYVTGAVLPVDGGWTAFGGPGAARRRAR